MTKASYASRCSHHTFARVRGRLPDPPPLVTGGCGQRGRLQCQRFNRVRRAARQEGRRLGIAIHAFCKLTSSKNTYPPFQVSRVEQPDNFSWPKMEGARMDTPNSLSWRRWEGSYTSPGWQNTRPKQLSADSSGLPCEEPLKQGKL